jgi:hypothetical protein
MAPRFRYSVVKDLKKRLLPVGVSAAGNIIRKKMARQIARSPCFFMPLAAIDDSDIPP